MTGLEPLVGFLICVVVLFTLCVLACVIYVFVRVLRAQKRIDRKHYDTFRRL